MPISDQVSTPICLRNLRMAPYAISTDTCNIVVVRKNYAIAWLKSFFQSPISVWKEGKTNQDVALVHYNNIGCVHMLQKTINRIRLARILPHTSVASWMICKWPETTSKLLNLSFDLHKHNQIRAQGSVHQSRRKYAKTNATSGFLKARFTINWITSYFRKSLKSFPKSIVCQMATFIRSFTHLLSKSKKTEHKNWLWSPSSNINILIFM